jgi:hypothetical protein
LGEVLKLTLKFNFIVNLSNCFPYGVWLGLALVSHLLGYGCGRLILFLPYFPIFLNFVIVMGGGHGLSYLMSTIA